ncbi:MAG: AzlC family ABC transporter permease [Methanothrix sp.]|nr:AzlC family ABC transporter permease [Methanothrix sp.]
MVKAVASQPQEGPDSMIKVLDEAETNRENEPTLASIKDGIEAAWPICIGYIPLGIAFGILAQKAGFDLLDIGIMSTVVFAGSSQFIAVSMLSAGAAPLSIVLTTFAVNLRHVLMSSALAVYLHGVSRRFLSLFAYGVTDESFAVNIVRFREGGWHPHYALVVNQAANLTWIASTVLGGYGGQFIAPKSFGIDYALSAMFLCLLVFQLQGRIHLLTAAMAGLLATAISILLPGNSFVIIASVLGASLGFAIKRYALQRGWLNA